MGGDIYGAMYYNITAWQQLVYQMPFGRKTSKLLPELLGMDPAEFDIPTQHSSAMAYLKVIAKTATSLIFFSTIKKKYENNWHKVLSVYSQDDFNGLDHRDLINTYYDIESKLGNNWLAPVLNGFYAMLFFPLLKNIVKKSRLASEYPNFINDILFSQGDIISVRIVREFQSLIAEVQSDENLNLLFNTNTPEIIYQTLKTEQPDFLRKIEKYISFYGVRCEKGELKMETINFQENPISFIAYLKTNSVSFSRVNNTEFHFNYKDCVNKAYRNNIVKNKLLSFLIQITLHRIRDRENYRFIRTQTFSLIRKVFRAMDESLLKHKLIKQQGDSLYLNYGEILNRTLSTDYTKIIELRKSEFQNYQKIEHANRYCIIGEKIVPVERKQQVNATRKLQGIGCCSGIVSGKVKLINPGNTPKGEYSDNILVASYFDPGSINLFGQAKGLVSEKGNLLSHTAILCREMGIPSIIGVRDITTLVNEGDIIQINGATGEINILKDGI
jgi:pyruvate,water dikinase